MFIGSKRLHEVEIWLKEVVRSVMARLFPIIAAILPTCPNPSERYEYIDTNYANDKMSLQDLCRHVLMSTSYFSLVFKQHTGETFIEYLTRCAYRESQGAAS